jgi:hypothetical protein
MGFAAHRWFVEIAGHPGFGSGLGQDPFFEETLLERNEAVRWIDVDRIFVVSFDVVFLVRVQPVD